MRSATSVIARLATASCLIAGAATATPSDFAQATRVEVVLDFTSNEVQLQIRDNGCGFEPRSWEVSKRSHFGLTRH